MADSPSLTLEHLPGGSAPLYERIADEVRRRVDAGIWSRGHRLRSEAELAADLNVARGTIRRAIALLVESGHLVQRQGVGTFVSGREGLRIPGRFESLGQRMERNSVGYTTLELEREIVEVTQPSGAPVRSLRVRRLRLLDGVPMSVLVNQIPLDVAPGIEEVDLVTMSLYTLLERSFGVAIERSEMTFGAVAADEGLSALLDVPIGAPLTHLVQSTYGPGDVCIDDAETWIRPDRHQPTVSLWRTNS
ncbi:GntR family transcriptional regulator [Microbacter sp. GSS18]|nr:GntR family transcriptional regulator [Microbacter sp. GSS18]